MKKAEIAHIYKFTCDLKILCRIRQFFFLQKYFLLSAMFSKSIVVLRIAEFSFLVLYIFSSINEFIIE